MRKPRHLSPEDRAIWDQVARRVVPMHPRIKHAEPAKPHPKSARPRPQPALTPFEVGAEADVSRSHDLLPGLGHALRQAPVQMDFKTFSKMSRGKLKPEARIDLHGMTLDEAHPQLRAFILAAQEQGKRLVLVITGKGLMHDTGSGRGILRRHVPQWLRLPPLAQAVLEIRTAHLRHGGEGAYYVYLRRGRQAG